uniref:Uncharacterized protein n=1 Tax=Sinocyclocheilus anshuiensis TaxID=1608454 RepID=A0A671NFZ6_9TELE
FTDQPGSETDQPWRPRVFSAPPNAAVSVKYGRRLRRITDEFDILLEKGVRRTESRELLLYLYSTNSVTCGLS